MAKNTFSLPGGFTITGQEPVDSRCTVEKKDDLYLAKTWEGTGLYNGMTVSTQDEGNLYVCINRDQYTQSTSWKIVGDISGFEGDLTQIKQDITTNTGNITTITSTVTTNTTDIADIKSKMVAGMHYKGLIAELPTSNSEVGDVYKVTAEINRVADRLNEKAEIGDFIVCSESGTSSTSKWDVWQMNVTNDAYFADDAVKDEGRIVVTDGTGNSLKTIEMSSVAPTSISDLEINNLFGSYSITIANPKDGSTTTATITANPSEYADKGSTVTLTYTATTGYVFSSWNVKNGNRDVTVNSTTNNSVTTHTFVMPEGNVTVTCTMTKKA